MDEKGFLGKTGLQSVVRLVLNLILPLLLFITLISLLYSFAQEQDEHLFPCVTILTAKAVTNCRDLSDMLVKGGKG